MDTKGIQLTKEEIIEDLKYVARVLKKTTLNISEYEQIGKYHYWEVKIELGAWNVGLKTAGLRGNFNNPKLSKNDIITDLRKAAGLLNSESLSRNNYNIYGKYNEWTVKQKFGSWNKAIKAAGLKEINIFEDTENGMINNLIELKEKLGRVPKLKDINPIDSKFSLTDYKDKFGSWSNALEKAGLYINQNHTISNDELMK